MVLILIVVFSALFVVTHLGMSHGAVRENLVAKLGGLTPLADGRQARIERRGEGGRLEAIPLDLHALLAGGPGAPGDVALFSLLPPKEATEEDEEPAPADDGLRVTLHQSPIVEGALLSLDVGTDEVLALVGGYDFERSQFNRATQARRQPGSAFKPIVAAVAMDAGVLSAEQWIDHEMRRMLLIQKPDGVIEGWRCRVFVSRGVGAAILPIRLNCRAELAVLILKREEENR